MYLKVTTQWCAAVYGAQGVAGVTICCAVGLGSVFGFPACQHLGWLTLLPPFLVPHLPDMLHAWALHGHEVLRMLLRCTAKSFAASRASPACRCVWQLCWWQALCRVTSSCCQVSKSHFATNQVCESKGESQCGGPSCMVALFQRVVSVGDVTCCKRAKVRQHALLTPGHMHVCCLCHALSE